MLSCCLRKAIEVYGTYRRTSSVNFWRIEELGIFENPNLTLVEHDLLDLASSIRLIQLTGASEVYNLAAQSFVGVSFDQPVTTAKITGIGALNLLEAIRIVDPTIRFYQASTSEMFGKVQAVPQNETTPFHPRSPYGVAKLYAHWITVNYRESYDIFGSSGILFNHESPLRGREFVTRKITDGVARIKAGKMKCLALGNLDAQARLGIRQGICRRDVANAAGRRTRDVCACDKSHGNRSRLCRDGVQGRRYCRRILRTERGEEVAVDTATGNTVMRIDPHFYRPAEVELLIGDPSKATEKLGWKAQTTLEELCRMMVEADLRRNSPASASDARIGLELETNADDQDLRHRRGWFYRPVYRRECSRIRARGAWHGPPCPASIGPMRSMPRGGSRRPRCASRGSSTRSARPRHPSRRHCLRRAQ